MPTDFNEFNSSVVTLSYGPYPKPGYAPLSRGLKKTNEKRILRVGYICSDLVLGPVAHNSLRIVTCCYFSGRRVDEGIISRVHRVCAEYRFVPGF